MCIRDSSGDYAILTGSLSAPNQNLWIAYAKTYAAEKYPNLNLVTDPIPTEEKQQEAYSKTLDLVKAYPDPVSYTHLWNSFGKWSASAICLRTIRNSFYCHANIRRKRSPQARRCLLLQNFLSRYNLSGNKNSSGADRLRFFMIQYI